MKRWTIDAPSSSQYHEDPEGEWVQWQDVRLVIEEVAALPTHKLRHYQYSGPFRRICRAELNRRLAEGRS